LKLTLEGKFIKKSLFKDERLKLQLSTFLQGKDNRTLGKKKKNQIKKQAMVSSKGLKQGLSAT
jgi:hypothetical protein